MKIVITLLVKQETLAARMRPGFQTLAKTRHPTCGKTRSNCRKESCHPHARWGSPAGQTKGTFRLNDLQDRMLRSTNCSTPDRQGALVARRNSQHDARWDSPIGQTISTCCKRQSSQVGTSQLSWFEFDRQEATVVKESFPRNPCPEPDIPNPTHQRTLNYKRYFTHVRQIE